MSGQVIAVWGPKGAPGRTSLSIGIATDLALQGRSVVLVDADTYGGAVAGYLELFDEVPGFLAFARLAESGKLTEEHRERLTHKFQAGRYSIDVLTGITNPARWPELTSSRVRSAVSALAETHDFVILDCGFNLEEDEEISSDLFAPRRNQATIACIKSSDVIVAVSGPDVVSIARYIHALEGLRTISEDAPTIHVVNRMVRSGGLSGAGQTVRNTLHRFAGLDDVLLIDDDTKGFNAALDSALPLQLSAPRSPVVKQLHALTQVLVEARYDETIVRGRRVTEPVAD